MEPGRAVERSICVRTRWIQTVSAGVAGACLTLAPHPRIDLDVVTVVVPHPANRVRAEMHRHLRENDGVVAQGPDRLVVEFSGRAGLFDYMTTEEVRLTPRGAMFRHLEGPFRTCRETIDIDPRGQLSVVTHRGHLVMNGGLVGWLFGVLVIRKLFTQQVSEHLQELASDSQPSSSSSVSMSMTASRQSVVVNRPTSSLA